MATSATVFANPNYVCVPPGVKSVPSVVTYAAASSGPPVKVWVRAARSRRERLGISQRSQRMRQHP